jgi:hypothetical protein
MRCRPLGTSGVPSDNFTSWNKFTDNTLISRSAPDKILIVLVNCGQFRARAGQMPSKLIKIFARIAYHYVSHQAKLMLWM